MTQYIKKRSRRVALALAAALSGGSVFGACEGRFKDAIVEGTTSLIVDPRVGLVSSLGAVASGATVSYTAEPFGSETDNGE